MNKFDTIFNWFLAIWVLTIGYSFYKMPSIIETRLNIERSISHATQN